MAQVKPTPPKPKTANPTQSLPQTISQGLGYLVMWSGSCKETYNTLKTKAVDAGLPVEITKDISQHTVQASLGLAKGDTRWKKVLHNNYRVEVRELSRDTTSGVTVMEFLGYELTDDGQSKKGKRTHFDKVAIDDKGNWIGRGTTEVAQSFIELVDDHRAFLRGQDLYEKITAPALKMMRRVRIARNCYYVANTPENNVLIDALDKLMASVGYSLVCLTQQDDQRTKKGLVAQITQDLNDRIATITDKVADWKSKNRVHGRSSKAVFEELAEIVEDTEGMEKALSISLQSLQDQIKQVQMEADVIINSQAPAGVNDLAFDDFQKILKGNGGTVLESTPHGDIIMVIANDIKDHTNKAGDQLKKSAQQALKTLGYYSYMKDGILILRPIAELAA